MSTHATISIKDNEGVHTYYCHYDGHLDSLGKKLVEFYTGANVHLLNTGKPIRCVNRDGSVEFFDDQHGVNYFKNEADYMKSDAIIDQEYAYYWNGRAWYMIMDGCSIKLKDVKFRQIRY